MRMRVRFGWVVACLAALLLVAAIAPIAVVEIGCGRGAPLPAPQTTLAITDSGYRRAAGDSYLTYPEWYIVHAYADLAGVTRQSSESRYGYAQAIRTFWG